MADQRRAGKISFQVNGVLYEPKGEWEYDLGAPKREAIIGADGVHGYKEVPKPPFIRGKITDRSNLDLAPLVNAADVTVTLLLNNGKVIVLREAWFSGDGTARTDEAEIDVEFQGMSAEEVR